MKAEDFKGKTIDELKKLLVDLKKQQFNLRFQRSQGQLENTSQIRVVRRDISRVRTFMSVHNNAAKAGVEEKVKAKTSSKAKKTSKKAA